MPVDGCRWFNGAECAPTQRGPSFLGAQTRAVTSLPFLQGALPDFRLPAHSPPAPSSQPAFTAEPRARGSGRSKAKSPAGKTQLREPLQLGARPGAPGTRLRKPWFECCNPFFSGKGMLALHKTQGETLSVWCDFAPRRHWATYGDVSGCHDGGGGATGTWRVEARTSLLNATPWTAQPPPRRIFWPFTLTIVSRAGFGTHGTGRRAAAPAGRGGAGRRRPGCSDPPGPCLPVLNHPGVCF